MCVSHIRIQALKRLMEQVISNTVELTDEADIIKEKSEELQEKLAQIVETNVSLQRQADRLACRVQFLSPVFSEAEECMKKEMEGLRNHIEEMKVTTGRVSFPQSYPNSHSTSIQFLCVKQNQQTNNKKYRLGRS